VKIPARKKWGQNFLIDPNIIHKIVSVLNLNANNHILEIGPGKGALTKQLSKIGHQITAIEIDPMLCTYLKDLKLKNVNIINKSILDFDCSTIEDDYVIIGNLPYNISTPILFKFMAEKRWNQLVVMLQKEVAERIVSKENNKKYGRTSIMMQSFFNIELSFHIPNTVFRPMPEIKSSLLSITPKNNHQLDYNNLKNVVQNAFKHRRKKLTHNLKNIIEPNKLKEVENQRAEQLTITQYQELSHFIIKK